MNLDVGCGRRKLSDVHIDILRTVKPDICCDLHHLPLKENTFDKVTSFEVVEHASSPLLMLEEIHRVLIHEGKLILSTPNPYLWRSLIRIILFKKYITSDTHIACFGVNELENLAQIAGFKNIHVNYENVNRHREYWKPRFKFLDHFVWIRSIKKRQVIITCLADKSKAIKKIHEFF